MKTNALAVASVLLAAVFFDCSATPKLEHEDVLSLAKSEKIGSVWKYTSEPGQDPFEEANYFLYLYSTPESKLKETCLTHKVSLDLKVEGSQFRVLRRSGSDYVAFKSCEALQPEDFVEISSSKRKPNIQNVLKIVQAGIPKFKGGASTVNAASSELRKCFYSASPEDLLEIVVYSEDEVAGLFSANTECANGAEIYLQKLPDGKIKASVKEALSPYTIRKRES